MANDGVSRSHLSEDQVVAFLGHELSGEALAQVELHLAACPACRTEVIEAREILAGGRGGGRRPGILAVLAVAAAILVVAVMLPRERAPAAVRRLGELAQAPVYLGVPVRQAAAVPDSLFDSAMRTYAAGKYGDAATGLQRALTEGADTVPTLFFLGASLLMTDRPEPAAEAFRQVIASGGTPYRPEARFYLAKALLRMGNTEDALRQLRAAAGERSEIAPEAAALADSVEAVARR